jgi:hypothetical protein
VLIFSYLWFSFLPIEVAWLFPIDPRSCGCGRRRLGCQEFVENREDLVFSIIPFRFGFLRIHRPRLRVTWLAEAAILSSMVKSKKTSDRTCSDSKKETCNELQVCKRRFVICAEKLTKFGFLSRSLK